MENSVFTKVLTDYCLLINSLIKSVAPTFYFISHILSYNNNNNNKRRRSLEIVKNFNIDAKAVSRNSFS